MTEHNFEVADIDDISMLTRHVGVRCRGCKRKWLIDVRIEFLRDMTPDDVRQLMQNIQDECTAKLIARWGDDCSQVANIILAEKIHDS